MRDKNERYKLSIIIPAYNAGRYIRRCMESFIHQLDERTEVFIVHDRSTDDTGAICDEYERAYPNITVINQVSHGMPEARNEGIQASGAEWVTFCDADDELPKDFYATVTSYWDMDEDVILFDAVTVDEPKRNNGAAGCGKEIQLDAAMRDAVAIGCYLSDSSSWGGYSAIRSQNGKLFRRRFLEEKGLHYTDGLRHAEDMLFCLQYSSCFDRALYVSRITYYYYFHNAGSAVNRYKPELEQTLVDCIDAFSAFVAAHPNYAPYEAYNRLTDIFLYLKYDLFYPTNRETDKYKRIRMRRLFLTYRRYYVLAKNTGLIGRFALRQRAVLCFAMHNAYLPLKWICKVKYR